MTPYKAGYDAGYAGIPSYWNPYSCESPEFEEWDEGYVDGCDDYENRYIPVNTPEQFNS
jgi:hypothetical protein